MTGAAVVMLLLAFLPALLPLSQGRILATIGVGLLCICAALALPFLVLPGVVLWFIALFIGMWSANDAKRDQQHKRMMQAMTARQMVSDTSSNAKYLSHLRRYKPAFSNRMVYEAHINGEKRKFWTEWEAIDFVARRTSVSETASQLVAPDRQMESYKGVKYALCSDHSVTAYTSSGTEAFPSMYAFRTWVENQQSEIVPSNANLATAKIDPRIGNHGVGSVIDQGTYIGYRYHIFSNGVVVSPLNGEPYTWANESDFRAWVNQHQKAAS